MNSTLKIIYCLPTLAALWLFSPSVSAGQVSSFGQQKPATLADMRPHLTDDEWFKEEWNHNAWTAEGHFIAIDFVVSNLGVGDHNGAFRAKVTYPDGKQIKCKEELDSDEWSWSRQGFKLKFGRGQVTGDLKGVDVTVRCRKLTMDLRFENQSPPYKPGRGKLDFGEGGFFFKSYSSPRARVTGKIKTRRKTMVVDAPGLVEHSAYNLAPHKFSRRWFRFQHVDKNISIMLSELETPRNYSGVRRGWAMIYGPKNKLISTARVNYTFEGFIKDRNSKEGYRIPRRVKLAAVDGKDQLTGQMVMTSLKKVRNPISGLNFIVRSLISKVSKPMDYSINCRYELRVKNQGGDQSFSGDGVYRFIYINP